VLDQLVDRTHSRADTYYDSGAVHVSFADPYCPVGRRAVLDTARQRDQEIVDGGTMVVIEGQRFSTRAESRMYAEAGGAVVNMTGEPEATLARELGLCYTSIALVTDHDAGVEGEHGVTMEEVFRVFRENTDRMRELLLAAVAVLPQERSCPCTSTLDGLTLPFALPE
jgi:5'-methylthioadenosine phosphorylase